MEKHSDFQKDLAEAKEEIAAAIQAAKNYGVNKMSPSCNFFTLNFRLYSAH
jgi:hypothetical protein